MQDLSASGLMTYFAIDFQRVIQKKSKAFRIAHLSQYRYHSINCPDQRPGFIQFQHIKIG
jgi:hypothetical protein